MKRVPPPVPQHLVSQGVDPQLLYPSEYDFNHATPMAAPQQEQIVPTASTMDDHAQELEYISNDNNNQQQEDIDIPYYMRQQNRLPLQASSSHHNEDTVSLLQAASSSETGISSIPDEIHHHDSLYRHQFAAKFPDPMADSSKWRRFLNGMAYPFNAVKYFCTSFVMWYALLPAFIVALTIAGSVLAGILLGNGVVRGIWRPVPENAWVWLWNFLPYNLYYIFWMVLIGVCYLFISIFMSIVFLLLRPCLERNARDLSYMTERKMLGLPIFWLKSSRERATAQKIQVDDDDEEKGRNKPLQFESDEESVEICWFSFVFDWNIFKIEYIVAKIKQKFIDFVRTTIDSTVRSIITSVMGSVINSAASGASCLIPGLGCVISAPVYVMTAFYQLAMEGIDVPMARHKYSYYEQIMTSWNNLSVILGCGCGLFIIMITPLVILFYPILIISTTTLFLHLDVHKRTARRNSSISILSNDISYAGAGRGNFLWCFNITKNNEEHNVDIELPDSLKTAELPSISEEAITDTIKEKLANALPMLRQQ